MNLSYLQVSRDEFGNPLFSVTWTTIIARVPLLAFEQLVVKLTCSDQHDNSFLPLLREIIYKFVSPPTVENVQPIKGSTRKFLPFKIGFGDGFAFTPACSGQGRASPFYRLFSHDVTSAILVSQNNETAAMLVSQTNPVGDELFSYANDFFCSKTFA